MCGRFNVIATPGLEELLRSLGAAPASIATRYNIAPTEDIDIVIEGALHSARWWLTPAWSDGPSQKYAMFNARSETLNRSRAFRKPFQTQRGIVPMSSFIEWRKSGSGKQPWRITNEDSAMAVAALWDKWHSPDGGVLLSCTLVTTAAAPEFEPWHSRMPVLLTQMEAERWLDNTAPISNDDELFQPRLKYALGLDPITPAAGNARNKTEEDQAVVGESCWLPH